MKIYSKPRKWKQLLSILRLGPEYPVGSRSERKKKEYKVIYRGGKQPPNPPPPPKAQVTAAPPPPTWLSAPPKKYIVYRNGNTVLFDNGLTPTEYKIPYFSVRYGVYRNFVRGNYTVEDIYHTFAKQWNMKPDVSAYIGNTKVFANYVIQDGEELEFHRKVGLDDSIETVKTNLKAKRASKKAGAR